MTCARSFRLRLLTMAVFFLLAPAVSAVTIDWVTVGDPGNAADTTGYGAAAQTFQISMYEVTNAQYAELLNAVADTDTYGLYNANMGSVPSKGGITRSGSSGSFTYSAITGRENMSVNHVSFYDSLRFANWLHNGQPTGAQDSTTTEDGAYTFSGINSVGARNAGATIYLTSEDEWYKAAYYDTGAMIYFAYPAGMGAQTTCTTAGTTANTANCNNVVGDLTDVGSYTGAASPNGTFDQGGNVWEWNEALISSDRGLRGGSFLGSPGNLTASYRYSFAPSVEDSNVGFRVASVPEPGTRLLQVMAMLVLAGLRRRRA